MLALWWPLGRTKPGTASSGRGSLDANLCHHPGGGAEPLLLSEVSFLQEARPLSPAPIVRRTRE